MVLADNITVMSDVIQVWTITTLKYEINKPANMIVRNIYFNDLIKPPINSKIM